MHRNVPLSRIKSSLDSNWHLDDAEVVARKNQYGQNKIIESFSRFWSELIRDTVKDPMIWFLVGAAILFGIVKNYHQSIILLLATIPLIGIDIFLQWRTQASTRSLSSHLVTYAMVIRNGVEQKIVASEIVPGDLIVVSTGDYFPADGIIVNGENIQVDESALTGEAFPVYKKMLNELPPGINGPAIAGINWGFAGTRVLTGRLLLRVVFTGQETLYGKIVASALQNTQIKTPLQKAIMRLIFVLIVAAILLCLILFWVRIAKGFGYVDALLSAATLAVAALPDEFPVVFTFFLGVGVYRLARKKALVRRAVTVENIGRVTCICADKTGTITEGMFRLANIYPAIDKTESRLLYLATVASRSESGDPLDSAIISASNKNKMNSQDSSNISETNINIIDRQNRLVVFPFTEERKRETVIIQLSTEHLLVVSKGAPETILAISQLSAEETMQWQDKIIALASSGNKVIACAERLIKKTDTLEEPTSHYQFAGLLTFVDPPREGVTAAMKLCRDSQIHVLMITGDHPETARAIAKEIGLGAGNPKVMLAENIDQFKEGDYFQRVDVIARALPSQKYDVVTALQGAGEIVAVTGDGVNDVPALKVADIGIAMGERGTQSAREVAAIVLLDDNFDSIVGAITEGRQLFKNLTASFKYLLMAHIPFVFSAALIPLLGYPLLYFPIHIVWIELIIHPTSLLVFQDLPPRTQKLEPVNRNRKVSFFNTRDYWSIFVTGVLTTFLVMIGFVYNLKAGHNILHARAFSLAMLSFIIAGITIGLSGLRNMVSKIITGTVIIAAIILIQMPMTDRLLQIMPLHVDDWLKACAGMILTILFAR